MPASVLASVPGKVILMGEHAAVYGGPALVAALDRRVAVEVALADSGVELDLISLGVRDGLTWAEILDYRDLKLAQWHEFEDRGVGFDAVRGEDPDHVVKIGVGEAARDLGCNASELPPLRVTVRSELPIGSGFGSSSAVAVGVVAALLRLLTGVEDLDRIARLAMEVERRQHGRPSGVDHLTAIHGGILSFQAGIFRPLAVEAWVELCFALYDTGRPAESTGDVVAAVRDSREQDPTSFDRGLSRAARAVRRFEELLQAPRPDERELIDVIGDYEAWLEGLGVVPRAVREVVAQLVEIGAAAKISGAGSLSGEAAGCLLVYRPGRVSDQVHDIASRYAEIAGKLCASGLLVEEAP